MSQHDDLNQVLRMLADAGPREAPRRIEAAVVEAFRRSRKARRMPWAVAVAAATGAVAASIALVAGLPKATALPDAISLHTPPPAIAWTSAPATLAVVKRPAAAIRKPTQRPAADRVVLSEFVPLPYGDDALIGVSARIVRVELPRSALRLAGFNVAQERASDRVQADVLLGADGLAHAVRFVRYSE